MRSSHTVDRVDTTFDDDCLVGDAGLLLPETLAAHPGLKQLVDRFLDLGRAAVRSPDQERYAAVVLRGIETLIAPTRPTVVGTCGILREHNPRSVRLLEHVDGTALYSRYA